MKSDGASIPGKLKLNFTQDGNFNDLIIDRLGGQITLSPKSNVFEWQASKFRLDRLEVALPPEKSFKRIFGQISGQGILSMDPILFNGELNLDYFRLLGIKLNNASIKGEINSSSTNLTGELIPSEDGKILFDIKKESEYSISAQLKDISSSWITATALEIPKFGLKYTEAIGKADDLEKLIIGSPNISLDSQLKALTKSQNAYREEIAEKNSNTFINPYDLKGNVNADIKLSGPKLSDLKIES